MEKFVQLTCIVIGLEVLDGGPIFSGIDLYQERGGIICKHRRTEKRKRKCASLFIKYLQTAFLKSTKPLKWDSMPWQSEVITK